MTRNDETKKKPTTIVVDAGVVIETLRSREPWGLGRWYAEIRDARTDRAIYSTDFGGRHAVVVDALAECFVRGLAVRS